MNRLHELKMRVRSVLTVMPVVLLLALGAVGAFVPQRAYAAASSVPEYIPSEGIRFWLTYMSNNNLPVGSGDLELKLFITARRDATVTLHYTADGSTTDVPVSANTKVEVAVDKSLVYNTEQGKNNHSLLITSTDTQ